jgi:hypothetical protein
VLDGRAGRGGEQGRLAIQTALGGYQSIRELMTPGGRLYESRKAILEAVKRSMGRVESIADAMRSNGQRDERAVEALERAVDALAEIGSRRAMPALLNMLDTGDERSLPTQEVLLAQLGALDATMLEINSLVGFDDVMAMTAWAVEWLIG